MRTETFVQDESGATAFLELYVWLSFFFLFFYFMLKVPMLENRYTAGIDLPQNLAEAVTREASRGTLKFTTIDNLMHYLQSFSAGYSSNMRVTAVRYSNSGQTPQICFSRFANFANSSGAAEVQPFETTALDELPDLSGITTAQTGSVVIVENKVYIFSRSFRWVEIRQPSSSSFNYIDDTIPGSVAASC